MPETTVGPRPSALGVVSRESRINLNQAFVRKELCPLHWNGEVDSIVLRLDEIVPGLIHREMDQFLRTGAVYGRRNQCGHACSRCCYIWCARERDRLGMRNVM